LKLLAAALFSLFALPAYAAGLTTEYTRNDPQQDCDTFDESGSGEGEWSDMVCPGVMGYPYYIVSTDGREAVTYGYAQRSGMPTFGAFNYAHSTVEWRMARQGRKTIPVAAIQRFYLADVNGEWSTQILVVSKVGQPNSGGACVVGYVSANEGASANRRARELSNTAASFRCGRDRPSVERKIRQHVPQ
jgi:hypothetical protein